MGSNPTISAIKNKWPPLRWLFIFNLVKLGLDENPVRRRGHEGRGDQLSCPKGHGAGCVVNNPTISAIKRASCKPQNFCFVLRIVQSVLWGATLWPLLILSRSTSITCEHFCVHSRTIWSTLKILSLLTTFSFLYRPSTRNCEI